MKKYDTKKPIQRMATNTVRLRPFCNQSKIIFPAVYASSVRDSFSIAHNSYRLVVYFLFRFRQTAMIALLSIYLKQLHTLETVQSLNYIAANKCF